jgi:hypothetical protein
MLERSALIVMPSVIPGTSCIRRDPQTLPTRPVCYVLALEQ